MFLKTSKDKSIVDEDEGESLFSNNNWLKMILGMREAHNRINFAIL